MRSFFVYILFFILILCFGSFDAKTQDLKTTLFPFGKQLEVDSVFITDLSDKLNLYAYGILKDYNITFSDIESGRELKLRPNAALRTGLGFNYKWMGLAVAFEPPWHSDDEKYGETQRLDVQVNVFARSFGLDVTTQYYKGYYVSNPNDFMAWDKEEYPLLENLSTVSMELSGYYFTNHKKFSYRAAFVRNEIQKKSAGSFIIGPYARLDVTNAPDGIVPEDLLYEYDRIFDFERFASVNLGLSVGYTYTYVFFDNFFVNLSAVPGVGFKQTSMNAGDGIRETQGIAFRWIARGALGYEHEKFFVGLTAIATSNTIPGERLLVSSQNSKIRFFVGKRFNYKSKNKS